MKERHVKTFPEKYGYGDVREEAEEFLSTNWKRMDGDVLLFDKLPYLGYFRIDTQNRDLFWWWNETESDWINAKVVYVDDDVVHYYYFDTHHFRLAYGVEEHFGFVVRGNVLEKANEHEE
jgi:hypothetical protein